MNIQEHNQLRGEQTALRRMLAGIPAENVLDRSGLEARLEEVDERLAVARLSRENLREEQKTLHGEFQGVLPQARRFEFKLSAGGEVVRGKVGPGVADPDSINRRLHQPTEISVMATQVGSGKPRYVLLSIPVWE